MSSPSFHSAVRAVQKCKAKQTKLKLSYIKIHLNIYNKQTSTNTAREWLYWSDPSQSTCHVATRIHWEMKCDIRTEFKMTMHREADGKFTDAAQCSPVCSFCVFFLVLLHRPRWCEMRFCSLLCVRRLWYNGAGTTASLWVTSSRSLLWRLGVFTAFDELHQLVNAARVETHVVA